jgi:DNA-directed RNA polymerase subunit RPC12/RpoP
MIVKVEEGGILKWKCLICGKTWLPRIDQEYKYLRCANKACRKPVNFSGTKNG